MRIVGAAKPGTLNVSTTANVPYYIEDPESYRGDMEDKSEYSTDIKKTKSKTLLRNKPKYTKRPTSGVKLKKIDQSQLSISQKDIGTARKSLQKTDRTALGATEIAPEGDTFAALKIKLTPEQQDFITKYRKLEELDKVKEIKFFRCLGDPPITSEEIEDYKKKREEFIKEQEYRKYENIQYNTETDQDRVVVDTDLPMDMNPQLSLYQNNHFELRRR